ncbi:MAG: hypothetical protein ACP5GH_04665 [Nitrososphaeria archaeon]
MSDDEEDRLLFPDSYGGWHRSIDEATAADIKRGWEIGMYSKRERENEEAKEELASRSTQNGEFSFDDFWFPFLFFSGFFSVILFPWGFFTSVPITISIIFTVLGVISIIGGFISKLAHALGTLTVFIEIILLLTVFNGLLYLHSIYLVNAAIVYIIPLSVEWITISVKKIRHK